jgi:hypothetical protein
MNIEETLLLVELRCILVLSVGISVFLLGLFVLPPSVFLRFDPDPFPLNTARHALLPPLSSAYNFADLSLAKALDDDLRGGITQRCGDGDAM